MIIQNTTLAPLIKSGYSHADLQKILSVLRANGTLDFKALDNGLFPAAVVQEDTSYTGYASIWLRDNVHISNAHDVIGQTAVAARAVTALLAYMKSQTPRLEKMIRGETDKNSVMDRPHVRFDGWTLSDIEQTWAHAQNDALGYFVWLFFKLASKNGIASTPDDLKFMAPFPAYFEALPYWKDEDSGHWEETRKISASSIGVAVGGLTQMREYWRAKNLSGQHGVTLESLDKLIANGRDALAKILPSECVQPELTKNRRYDGALLFLIYPMNVLDAQTTDVVLKDIRGNLQGEYGIRRYIGDSFWCSDYKKKMSTDTRTADFSADLSGRDALLLPGQEAQWCIFDPIISAIYGQKYRADRRPEFLALQVEYLNRSLGQVTGSDCPLPAFRCPELYYSEDGKYIPSDATPLLWTQANLLIALDSMEKSVH